MTWLWVGSLTVVGAIGLALAARRRSRCGHVWIPAVGVPMALVGLIASGYDPTDEATFSELTAFLIMLGVVLGAWIVAAVGCAVWKARVGRARVGVSEAGVDSDGYGHHWSPEPHRTRDL